MQQPTSHGSAATPRSAVPPRRSPWARTLPVLVVALTVGLIAWSAWPQLRPARVVEVGQAIFVRPAANPSGDAEATRLAAADGRDITVQAPGWLEAEPYLVACAALADGTVAAMDVLEGDRVEAGQIVARLVPEDAELRLARADAALARAQAVREELRAELAAATTDWEEPVERDRAVEAGAAAVAEAEAELAQLPSLIAGADAHRLERAEQLARVEESRTQGVATELEFIVARQKLAEQDAVVASLRARRPLLRARVDRLKAELRAAERHRVLRVEERRRLAGARAALAASEANLVEREAERDEAELELARMVIRAPISGFVQRRLKVPGDKVIRAMDSPHSAHLVHLYDPSRLQVRVDVPLADASHVFVGQRCAVVVEVLPDRTFEGVVLRLTSEADLQKNTLQVKVGVLDPVAILKPEMLTRVRFLPGDGRRATSAASGTGARIDAAALVRVPTAAIASDGGKACVWIVRDRHGDRGVARPAPVEVVDQDDDWATIRGEVPAGALVVLGPEDLGADRPIRFRSGGEGGR